ncbi:DUF3857 domain-containing protein [Flexithrix dorotheae]|uniref:DUF3857 domain-containing protein n=1 Tax=Flexithrix dorotheae TaxID=70993 RepID=UPI0003706988|nr:DUF3857 domain-containing protein [Flexithrix dorotheae]
MNQLFLKRRIKYYCILWIFLFFCNSIFANDTIPDQSFTEHCKNADAFLLHSYTDVVVSKFLLGYKRKTTIQNKLVINNRPGVEEYAFLNLKSQVADRLLSLKVKTLKADGTMVELDSNLVFEQLSQRQDHVEIINYPIPGVEPGDTIETIYSYSEGLDYDELQDFVNLYSDIPSVNTEFTIRTPPNLMVRYKSYNGFPEPQVLSNDTLVYCLFKMEQVDGVSENEYTCLPCELPYIYYSVENRGSELRTWKDVYNQEFNVFTQPFRIDYENSSYYKKWKRRVIGEAKDSSKYYQLSLLLADIYKNIEIEQPYSEEMFKTTGYFLKEMRFDPISIKRLYRQLLEDLEIDFWAVFARSKRLGRIDPFYIRKGEYDHIFFAFESENGSLQLLYPHKIAFKYQVNEIPTSLYNVEAVIAKPFLTEKIKNKDKFINMDLEMAEVDSVITRVIKLHGMHPKFNYLKQAFYCDVDIDQQETSFKSNFSVAGGLSTDIRSFNGLLDKDKELHDFYETIAEFEGDESSLSIDSITSIELKNYRPFVYSMNGQGSISNSISFINDSIVSVTFDDLIQHSQIASEKDSTNLNFYLDYTYTDFCIFILKFPCDIEIINNERNKWEIKNKLGQYIFNLQHVSDNQMIIQSNYKIIKDIVAKTEYKQLKELNDFVDEVRNMRFLIKLKKA